MKKILVVDDENEICNMLKEYLEMEQYLVSTASNGFEALKKISFQPDLILMDINMPDMNGYELCQKIRDQITCPILFLSARTEERDRINGLKVGGDDYIGKPFSMEELLTRVEAHLRREDRTRLNRRIFMDDKLVIDFQGAKVFAEGVNIGLTKTEYLILELLITNAGQVFDKEKIYERVRGFDGEADSSIVMEHIRRLRKKIQKYTMKNYIETVWGIGYRWIG
jgi:two-component system, OmpR family, lantibiotic biosynthesis response regulator NisR/SpaR